MAEPEYYRIRNWEEFQHYTDRRPPWIKLYPEMLSSLDWSMWSDESRLLAIVCMMIASEDGPRVGRTKFASKEVKDLFKLGKYGRVPNNPEYIKYRGHLHSDVDLSPLVSSGFLVPGEGRLDHSLDSSLDPSLFPSLPQRQRQINIDSDSDISSTFGKDNNGSKRKVLERPAREEVLAYMLEKGVKQDIALRESDLFVNFYESKGWLVGKSPMKQWRSAVSGWITRNDLATDMKTKWAQEDALTRAKELMDVPF